MDPHASYPNGPNSQPTQFKQPYQPYPGVPLNPNGVFLGSTVSQNLSYSPMYQGFFPNHPGSQVGYQSPPSFMFRERKGKMNWRNIANLDADELIGKGDIRTLESYLSNIAFANIDKEDIETFGDVNLLKLFRLSQYGLEYLLNCQNYLASQAQALDYQYRASEDHLYPLEEQAKRNQAEILNLKNEINHKKDVVAAYKNALNAPVYKCHLCTKLFKTQEFLTTHFQTRHENALSKDRRTPKAETAVQTQANPQQETAQMLEKLMTELKQNEEIKLSQLSSTLEGRLQEVIKTNKELTAKVAEMEKKMDHEREGSVSSPDQVFDRTIRRGNPQMDDLQSRLTPKKHGLLALKDAGSPTKQVFRAGELEDAETVKKQEFKAGSLKDLEDDQKQQKQAFNAGSLKDIEEEDIESVQNPSIGKFRSKKEHKRQLFRAGEVEDDGASPKNKKQAFKAGSLQDVDDEVQAKDVKKSQGPKWGIKKQIFNAGEMESEVKVIRGNNNYKAGALEDDTDFAEARNRKRSQEDFVIMEEEEEEEGHHGRKESHDREAKATEEIDEDEVREQHRNAVIKATNLIKNKYMHKIKEEDHEKAEKQVKHDLKMHCAKILRVDYDKLKDHSNDELAGLEKTLKGHTQKDLAPMEKLHLEYQEVTNRVQKPGAQEEGGVKSKNKLTQSTDLMNLVVDPERRSKEVKGSVEDATSKKKAVFESQNLESQLSSYEDLKKSGNGALRNGQNVKEGGTNLMKKSIQGGVAEYL